MAKKFSIDNFMKLSPEQQAKAIEKQTAELIKRLPTLKNRLKMYGDTSDELYNLEVDEVSLMGNAYSRAVRSGEITTTSSKQAYRNFIKNLQRYSRTNIAQLAKETAKLRMDSWLAHITSGSTTEDSAYAKMLFDRMTDEQKLGFTRSKYFMDSSYMYMVTEEDGRQYSIQTLKLELYCEEVLGWDTQHIYRSEVKKSEEPLRGYRKNRKK